MKLNTRQNRKSNNQKYLEKDRPDFDATPNENIIMEYIIDDDVQCDDDNYDIEEDIEYEPEDDECIDENENTLLGGVSNNIDNIYNMDNICTTDNVDVDNVDVDVDEDNEKLFYKELLNKHGFIFNEDKDCLLIYQEYIN